MSKILIVYYSRKGQNYWAGSIRNLSKGNTDSLLDEFSSCLGIALGQVAYAPCPVVLPFAGIIDD